MSGHLTTSVRSALSIASGPLAFASSDRLATALSGDERPFDPSVCLFFSAPLCHEGVNDNKDIWLREELEKAYPTLVGMPIDEDHILTVAGAVGKIYDADCFIDPRKGRTCVRMAAYVYADLYPAVARKLLDKVIRGTSMECWFDVGEQTKQGRVLRGATFIGAALTRMPADVDAIIDYVGRQEVRALVQAQRRRALIVSAAAYVAACQPQKVVA